MVYTAIALLPALLLMTWLYTRDRMHPEPKRRVYRLFLLGAGIVLPAGLIERALLQTSTDGLTTGWLATMVTAFFVAGMVEEFLKAAIVERAAFQRGWMDSPMDCIIYSGATALGFAAVENILYVTSSGFGTALVRSVTAVPAHMMFGIIMGVAFADATWRGRSRARAYILPALAHGTYDSFALGGGIWSDALLAAYLFALLVYCLRAIDKTSQQERRAIPV
jgi:protease PrsW